MVKFTRVYVHKLQPDSDSYALGLGAPGISYWRGTCIYVYVYVCTVTLCSDSFVVIVALSIVT